MSFKETLILLAILAAYGIVGRMDYDDAVRLEASMRAENDICAHALSAQRTEATAAALVVPMPAPDCATTLLQEDI